MSSVQFSSDSICAINPQYCQKLSVPNCKPKATGKEPEEPEDQKTGYILYMHMLIYIYLL